MDKTIKDKLLSCRTYEEAKPILETQGAGLSAHKLFDLGYGVQAKQPTVSKQLFSTAIQEMEDEEKKKIEEIDGGSSEQSSSTTGLEHIGTEHDAPESASEQPDKKDQMGVAINEAFPPQQPGMGQVPPMQPPQQQTGGTCGQPQMNPQQQMQYTIQEMANMRGDIRKIVEAVKVLDKKVQETQKEIPHSLDLGSSMGHKKSLAMIKETTGIKSKDLSNARQEIMKMNDALNSGRY